MAQLDVKEIHGYEPDLGFQVFTEAALRALDGPAAGGITATGSSAHLAGPAPTDPEPAEAGIVTTASADADALA